MHVIQPDGWPRPKGYSNGIAAQGEMLFVAGQIGWNEREEIVSDDFVAQAAQALQNAVAVVIAAGGSPTSVVRMTWYVTDKSDFAANNERLGEAYRSIMGAHYPAMSLVQVAALLEDRAKVEIEVTAVLPTPERA